LPAAVSAWSISNPDRVFLQLMAAPSSHRNAATPLRKVHLRKNAPNASTFDRHTLLGR
jgi:hypothetical protein